MPKAIMQQGAGARTDGRSDPPPACQRATRMNGRSCQRHTRVRLRPEQRRRRPPPEGRVGGAARAPSPAPYPTCHDPDGNATVRDVGPPRKTRRRCDAVTSMSRRAARPVRLSGPAAPVRGTFPSTPPVAAGAPSSTPGPTRTPPIAPASHRARFPRKTTPPSCPPGRHLLPMAHSLPMDGWPSGLRHRS